MGVFVLGEKAEAVVRFQEFIGVPTIPIGNILGSCLDLFQDSIRYPVHAPEKAFIGLAQTKRPFNLHPLDRKFRALELRIVGLWSILGPSTKQGEFARGKINLLAGDEVRLHLDDARLAFYRRLDSQKVLQVLVAEAVRGNPSDVDRDRFATIVIGTNGGPVAVTSGHLRAIGMDAPVLVKLGPKYEGVLLQSGPRNNVVVVDLRFLLQPLLAREALFGGSRVD